MSLAMINGTTVIEFVEDMNAFDTCVKECFEMLDVDGDEVLSRNELREGFCKLVALENESQPKEENDSVYNAIFERFDSDKNGAIDRNEFRRLMKEILSAMARGIGNSPVLVALEIDSLLTKVAEHDQLTKNEDGYRDESIGK